MKKKTPESTEKMATARRIGLFILGVVLYVPSVIVRLFMVMPRVIFECVQIVLLSIFTAVSYFVLHLISCGGIIPTEKLLEIIVTYVKRITESSSSAIRNSLKNSLKFKDLRKGS